MKLVAKETLHLQALIHSFIHVALAALIRALSRYCEHHCMGLCSTWHERLSPASCRSDLVWPLRHIGHVQLWSKSIQYFKYWCQLSCQCVSPSLGDNESVETIFLLPLAAELHSVALWLDLASMHSKPIKFTVSMRLKHVILFKSNERLVRSFRYIFQ